MGAAVEADRRRDAAGLRGDERDAIRGRDRDLGDVLDGQAGEPTVGDRSVEVRPGLRAADARHHRRLGGGAETRLVGRRIAAEQAGKDRGGGRRILDSSGLRRQGRSTPGRREAGDPGELDAAEHLGGHRVDRHEPVVVRGHEKRLPIGGRVHLANRSVDAAEGLRPADERRRGEGPDAVERGHVEGQDLAVRRPDEQTLAGGVDRQRDRTRHGTGIDERPVLEIVRAQLGPRDDMDAVAAASVRYGLVIAPDLDDRVANRHAKIARGADPVVAPRDEPAGHGVLREVRVGPLVDVVREPVAPILEELRGGPRVVDLVEVHLVRLREPEDPQTERRDDDHREEPHVQPVEAAGRLFVEIMGSVRPEWPVVDAGLEPADQPDLRERRPLGPGGHGWFGRPGGRGDGRGWGHATGNDGHTRPRGSILPVPGSRGVVDRAGFVRLVAPGLERSLERCRGRRPDLEERPECGGGIRQGDDRDPGRAPDPPPRSPASP